MSAYASVRTRQSLILYVTIERCDAEARMRGRVRLHSGGISPDEVRLRKRGATERKTAPGKDIRDIGPEVARKCASCGGRTYAPLKDCGPCLEDKKIIREVSALLRKHGQPPLNADSGPDGGYRKARKRGLQAKDRISKRRRKNGRPSTGRPARTTRARLPATAKKSVRNVKTCQRCFTLRSASGACLCS